MLVKWNDARPTTPESWHIRDGIVQVNYHGRMTWPEIHKKVEHYDGIDATIFHNMTNTPDTQEYFQYLAILIENRDGGCTREHWVMDFGQFFVLSDDGKTVDRFF